MKAYRVSGTFRMGAIEENPFTIEIAARKKDEVADKVYSLLGSKHGVKRRDIKLKEVKAIKKDDITDHVVRYLVTGE